MDHKRAMEVYCEAVEKELDSALECGDPDYDELIRAMRYAALGGGKRIRAVLTLEFCRIFSGDWRAALPFAASVEMIHAYSLAHDDLPCMDDDDMRRGKPSCHKKFGEATALLAGDGLLTLAFGHLTECVDIPADRTVRAVRELAAFSGGRGMVAGQYIDLANESRQVPVQLLDKMHKLKTSALIQAAGRLGAVAGGADADMIELAGRFCRKIGLAFQITDDVLDVTGDPAELGKPVMSDRENEKTTYVTVYGAENARKMADALFMEAKKDLAELAPEQDFLLWLTDLLADRRK